jgi:hypothetical protein
MRIILLRCIGAFTALLLATLVLTAQAATVTVFTAGVDDLYSTANGAELSSPSIGAVAASGPSKHFDKFNINVDVLHLFDLSSLSGTITGATLDIRARPTNSSDSLNDNLATRFYNDDGTLLDPDGNSGTDFNWGTQFGPEGASPNFLQGTAWDLALQPANGILFSLDLSNLPRSDGPYNLIPDLDAAKFLDVRVSDDTEVDFMTLTVTSTVVPVPAAVWLFGSALGLLGWMRRKAI